jgi:hypothetical protein
MTVWILLHDSDPYLEFAEVGGRTGTILDAFTDKGPAEVALKDALEVAEFQRQSLLKWQKAKDVAWKEAQRLYPHSNRPRHPDQQGVTAYMDQFNRDNPKPGTDNMYGNVWLVEIE